MISFSTPIRSILIADSLSMPVHWYYDPRVLQRDFGTITDFQAPKAKHPGSIMALSSTGGHGRGDQSGRIIGQCFVASCLCRDVPLHQGDPPQIAEPPRACRRCDQPWKARVLGEVGSALPPGHEGGGEHAQRHLRPAGGQEHRGDGEASDNQLLSHQDHMRPRVYRSPDALGVNYQRPLLTTTSLHAAT